MHLRYVSQPLRLWAAAYRLPLPPMPLRPSGVAVSAARPIRHCRGLSDMSNVNQGSKSVRLGSGFLSHRIVEQSRGDKCR